MERRTTALDDDIAMNDSGECEPAVLRQRSKLKGPRRGRRWSLDIISPRLHLWKRSRSIEDPELVPGFAHLVSVPQTIREESAFSFPWRRGSVHAQVKEEAYAVLELWGGQTLVVTGEDDAELKSLVGAAMMQERVSSYRVIVSSTKAFLRTSTSTASAFRSRSCENLLHIQQLDAFHLYHPHLADAHLTDDRFKTVTEMLHSEQHYCDSLQILFENYAEPLRKFSSLDKEDHRILFMGMEPIFSISASLVKKLEQAADLWDSASTKIGSFFSSKFWSVYGSYIETYSQAKQFLVVKLKADKAFDNFCQLQEQNGLPTLDTLLMLPVSGAELFTISVFRSGETLWVG